MHTDSSASRTWRLSRSASLNTATVAMRSSRHARSTRSAISPRLATRTLRNIRLLGTHPVGALGGGARGGSRRVRAHAGAEFAARGRRGVDRLPGPIGGRRDALELETQLVRVGAVAERLFLADQALAQQAEDRLVEGLHPVLGGALGHQLAEQRRLLLIHDVFAHRRRADHD